MPFPSTNRIIYKLNPLDNVICQVKFPSILRIESEPPAEFQEKIRQDFPVYTEKYDYGIKYSTDFQGQIVSLDNFKKIQPSSSINHEFSSENGDCKVNFGKGFIALSTTKYNFWEEFYAQLESILNLLIEVYKPSYFTRVGLRYIDVIRRSTLNLDDETDWNELLQPYILGIISDSNVGNKVISFRNQFSILLSDDESKVKIETSYAKPVDDGEICFMIDSDFNNTNKKDIEEVKNLLIYFNERASRLIQWCITDKLHKALNPVNPNE